MYWQCILFDSGDSNFGLWGPYLDDVYTLRGREGDTQILTQSVRLRGFSCGSGQSADKGERGPKSRKLCRRHLSMAPKEVAGRKWRRRRPLGGSDTVSFRGVHYIELALLVIVWFNNSIKTS